MLGIRFQHSFDQFTRFLIFNDRMIHPDCLDLNHSQFGKLQSLGFVRRPPGHGMIKTTSETIKLGTEISGRSLQNFWCHIVRSSQKMGLNQRLRFPPSGQPEITEF